MTDRTEIDDERQGRRDFLRKSVYVVPAIMTLQAYSAVAKAGSAKPLDDGDDWDEENTDSKKSKKMKKIKESKKAKG